jgi:predicted ATP-grasp superfamily ATP-dependent carboligase
VFFGDFGPASLTFARRCHAAGIEVWLLAPQPAGKPVPRVPARFAGAATIDTRLTGTPAGIEAIAGFLHDKNADALTAISERHCLWLAQNRTALGLNRNLLLPSAACLELLSSKEAQIRLAQEAGFDVLPTWFLRSRADVATIAADAWPVCVRPEAAMATDPPFKVLQAASSSQLLDQLCNERVLRGTVIVQPFRVLPNAVVHCTTSLEGSLGSVDAFLVDRKFEGLALRLRRMRVPDGMPERIQRFAAAAGLTGVFHFDFLYDPSTETPWFLEVNARFGGTTDKVLPMGVDEVSNCLHAYGVIPSIPSDTQHGRSRAVVNKRAILKHLLTVMRAEPQPWDFPGESRLRAALRSVSDLVFAKDSVFTWSDLGGSLLFHMQKSSQT